VSLEHRHAVTLWWAEVFGGPAQYSELGGYPRMLAHHRNLGLSAEQRFRSAGPLSVARDNSEAAAAR
jgi:hemoglobin